MQIPIIWGEPETSYIRRFMDGVSKVVTDEMQSGRSLPEESFTFVLARLLCWFNRPRLNRNIWLFLLLVLVQNLLYVSKCLVQSARLNQHRWALVCYCPIPFSMISSTPRWFNRPRLNLNINLTGSILQIEPFIFTRRHYPTPTNTHLC